jgi:general secretion pathway protein J
VIAQWEQDLAAIQATTAVPALTCDGQNVRIVRRAEGGLQVVAWALRPDSTNSMWQRWASQPVTTTNGLQENWMRTTQFQGSEPGQLRTLGGLEQWQVYFFRNNAWSNCQSTGDVASAGGAAPPTLALPLGVRIVLSFAPGSGLNGSLVRDVRVTP